MSVLLEVDDLTVTFGGLVAVDHVSLTVDVGVIQAIIGPNGAGKTTLLNVLSGICRPTSGRVLFDSEAAVGREIQGLAPHEICRRGIARTFQNVRLFPDMTVLENVLVAQHVRTSMGLLDAILRTPRGRQEERAMLERAQELLDLVGLGDCATTLAGALPYGHQRSLEIARALATRPRLLLLDEPAAGMSPSEARVLVQRIRQIRDRGITVILIEHNMRPVMDISDRIVVLDCGKKIAEGVPDEIRDNPAVIEAYLGNHGKAAAPAVQEEVVLLGADVPATAEAIVGPPPATASLETRASTGRPAPRRRRGAP